MSQARNRRIGPRGWLEAVGDAAVIYSGRTSAKYSIRASLGAIALVLFALIAWQPSAAAERRVALVIGNGDYRHSPSLRNPVNDARAVGDALRRIGFEVIEGLDLDIQETLDKVELFEQRLAGAQVALVYYAGHGVSVDGVNYLIPVDAEPDTRFSLQRETISSDDLLRQVMERQGRVSILILDACRSSAFASRLASDTRGLRAGTGLAEVLPVSGSLVAFAAQPGAVALDGDGANSPFTSALLHHLTTPGLEVEGLMKKVRLEVTGSTSRAQEPWSISKLEGDFYFVPEQPTPPPSPPPVTATLGYGGKDRMAFDAIEDSKRARDFELFAERFPDSALAPFALDRLTDLRKAAKEAAPTAALPAPTSPSVQAALPPTAMTPPATPHAPAPVAPSPALPPAGAPDADTTPSPAEIEAALSLGRADWRNLQQGLKAIGLSPGKIDGSAGQGTRRAVAAWQLRNGVDATGFLSDIQRDTILADKNGQICIGLMYLDGQDTKRDEKEGMIWLRKSAEQGHPFGQAMLGMHYLKEFNGLESKSTFVENKSNVMALRWLIKASAQGDPMGQLFLAMLMINSKDVSKKDLEDSLQLLLRLGKQGSPIAQLMVGMMYGLGKGIGKNDQEATRWIENAKRNGLDINKPNDQLAKIIERSLPSCLSAKFAEAMVKSGLH